MDNASFKQQRKTKEPKNKDLANQLDVFEREYDIDRESLIVLLEDSMQFAARKAPKFNKNIVITIDRASCNIKCKVKLYVVNKVEDPGDEIALDEVKELLTNRMFKVQSILIPGDENAITDFDESIIDKIDLGTEIEVEILPDFFGRIFIQTVWNIFCHTRYRP